MKDCMHFLISKPRITTMFCNIESFFDLLCSLQYSSLFFVRSLNAFQSFFVSKGSHYTMRNPPKLLWFILSHTLEINILNLRSDSFSVNILRHFNKEKWLLYCMFCTMFCFDVICSYYIHKSYWEFMSPINKI